jgi:hypothetical protein
MARATNSPKKNIPNPELKRLLSAAAPLGRAARPSLPALAEIHGVSTAALYKWLYVGRMPEGRIRSIIAAARTVLTFEDFAPFVSRRGATALA